MTAYVNSFGDVIEVGGEEFGDPGMRVAPRCAAGMWHRQGTEPDPTPTERRIVGVVACYFCGKRADGLTSNDTPSCASCRALPPRKR